MMNSFSYHFVNSFYTIVDLLLEAMLQFEQALCLPEILLYESIFRRAAVLFLLFTQLLFSLCRDWSSTSRPNILRQRS